MNIQSCSNCKYWQSPLSDREIDEDAECAMLAAAVTTFPRNVRIFTPGGFSCLHYERLWRLDQCDAEVPLS